MQRVLLLDADRVDDPGSHHDSVCHLTAPEALTATNTILASYSSSCAVMLNIPGSFSPRSVTTFCLTNTRFFSCTSPPTLKIGVGGLVLNELQNRTANASLVYTIGQQFNATRNTPYNIASARGRYQIIHRYSGTFCSFEFDGNSITNFKDGGAGWYKSSTNTDNFFNIYASGGKVCIKSMRDADSVFRFIVC